MYAEQTDQFFVAFETGDVTNSRIYIRDVNTSVSSLYGNLST